MIAVMNIHNLSLIVLIKKWFNKNNSNNNHHNQTVQLLMMIFVNTNQAMFFQVLNLKTRNN
jgi:hypothetical protein